MMSNEKLEILEVIAGVAEEMCCLADTPHNSPPPHRFYIVGGDLIRKLGTLIEKLGEVEGGDREHN
jgi:hypothetical protein